MYKPGVLNYIDALTRREQDLNALQIAKLSLQMQTLLKPKQIDLQIQLELNTN